MASIKVKIAGSAGETRTARMHHAVADQWRRAMEAKDLASRPKPEPVQRRTFAHKPG
jgi:hypothetical protein